MKCHICSHEIPEGKKYCPGCGRVVRMTSDNRNQDVSSETMRFTSPVTPQNNNSVYRPAASKTSEPSQTTIHIPDIFSADPNAPEYTDPHAYDTATAHVLEYDRMFVSRSTDRERTPTYEDDSTKRFSPVYSEPEAPAKRIIIEQEADYDDNYYDNYPETNDDYEEKPRRKNTKPNKNIITTVFIAIAVILGLTICVTGIYQIGKQFGFWAEEETTQNVAEDRTDDEKLPANKPAQTVADDENIGTSDYKTGVYTVKSDQKNIFVYKSVTDQRITATIPNGTVLEITEVKEDLGKTTYNSYSGWVEMTDLEYTPDEEPEKDEETTTKAEEESATEPSFPTEPGKYTVTLSGYTPLNVRDSNSTQGAIIAVLANGAEVEVTEVKSSWGKITVDGVEGWVYMQYLR